MTVVTGNYIMLAKIFLFRFTALAGLLALLLIFPASYAQLGPRYYAILSVMVVLMVTFLVKTGKSAESSSFLRSTVALTFVFMFYLADTVAHTGYIYLFTNKTISISTLIVLLSFAIYLIKVFFTGSSAPFVKDIFFRVFLATVAALVMAMVGSYFVLRRFYEIDLSEEVLFVNQILKSIFILVLVDDCLQEQSRLKQLSIGIVLSMTTAVILAIIF
jgi:hypothetical protein